MIEPLRQEMLARLSELAPDMRFGQLITNLAFMWSKERPYGLRVGFDFSLNSLSI
jgi:hypothetical protein